MTISRHSNREAPHVCTDCLKSVTVAAQMLMTASRTYAQAFGKPEEEDAAKELQSAAIIFVTAERGS